MKLSQLINRAKVLRAVSAVGSATFLLAFVLVLNWLISSMASVTERPTGAPAPTATASDPTADWLLYTGPAYGEAVTSPGPTYSIRYPPDWFVRDFGRIDSETIAYTAFSPTEITSPAAALTIRVTTRTYAEELELAEGYAINVTSEQDVMIGGVRGKRLIGTSKPSGETLVGTIIPVGEHTLVFIAKPNYVQQNLTDTLDSIAERFFLTQ